MSNKLVRVVVVTVLALAPQLASADGAAPEPKSPGTAFAYSAIGSAAISGCISA